jgi:hypothetical protein
MTTQERIPTDPLAAAALRAGELVARLTQTTDEEIRTLLDQLETAQRTLRAVLRERAALRRRNDGWKARELAIAPST